METTNSHHANSAAASEEEIPVGHVPPPIDGQPVTVENEPVQTSKKRIYDAVIELQQLINTLNEQVAILQTSETMDNNKVFAMYRIMNRLSTRFENELLELEIELIGLNLMG